MRKLFITIVALLSLAFAAGAQANHSFANAPHWYKSLSVPYNGTGSRAQVPVVPYLDNNASHDYWVGQATLEWMNWGSTSTPHNIQPVKQANQGGSLECSNPQNNCPAANGQIRVYDYEGGDAGGWSNYAYQYWCQPGTNCTPDLNTWHIVWSWMSLRTDVANHQKQQACHEMGHALGLDHQVATDSCLMNETYMFDGQTGNGECSNKYQWTGSCVVPNAHDDWQLHNAALHWDPSYSRTTGASYPSPASGEHSHKSPRATVTVACASPASNLVPTPALDAATHVCSATPRVLSGGPLTAPEIRALDKRFEVVNVPDALRRTKAVTPTGWYCPTVNQLVAYAYKVNLFCGSDHQWWKVTTP